MTSSTMKAMVPQSEKAAKFYDDLAADYDAMTGFEKRFIHEKPFLKLLVQRFGISSALDAGAGTGFHSLLLGQLGAEVTALDVSAEMLKKVRSHAKDLHLNASTVESDFLNIPPRLKNRFDAVFCMGNSLPHLLTFEELIQSLENFSSALHSQGVLIIQLLNYRRILAEKERIQSIKEAGDTVFVRFYEFHKEHVVFNILRLKKNKGGLVHFLDSVNLRPIMKEELTRALEKAGFVDFRFHGSIALDDFHEATSKDLVVLAMKQKSID